MLNSQNRLPLKHNKRHAFGQKIEDSVFTLLFKSRSSGKLKAAITVSKKVAPKAVDRNRIKRLIAESLKDKLKIQGDLIIKVNKNLAGLKKDEVASKLDALIKRLK